MIVGVCGVSKITTQLNGCTKRVPIGNVNIW